MSSNPPVPTPPANPTADLVKNVSDVLSWGLSLAFPALAPTILAADKALDALAPWVIAVVTKQQITPGMLKAMQADLNKLGPSFPAAGGYSNAFAGGATPAPGTTPTQAAPNTATLVINGATVTVSAESLEGLLAFLTTVLGKKTT